MHIIKALQITFRHTVSTHHIRHVHLKDLTYMINIKQMLEFVTGMLDSMKVQKANVHV